MANYTLVTFLVAMMCINVGLGLYDLSIKSYNPDFDNGFNFSSSPASKFTADSSFDSGVASTDVNSTVFFDTADSVNPDTGVSYTDSWKSTNKFLLLLESAGSLISSILIQPAKFMITMQIPVIFAVSFQIIWYVITLLLLLNFRKGGV